jgi:hypothetical protein
MRARLRFEHEARALLLAEGFRVLRSAGSRGPWDLFAINTEEVWLVQVKSTRRLGHHGTRSMLRHAACDLLGVLGPVNTRRWLFVRELNRTWHRVCIDGWPTERQSLDDRLKATIAEWQAAD